MFHPLCGARLPTLLAMLGRDGIDPARAHVAAIAIATAALRTPFGLAERLAALALVPRARYPAPVFIVGHWRSGTTHLANLLSRSGAFGILTPMAVGLPDEALGLGRIARPFVEQFFPRHRLIDAMALAGDLPQEDELAIANLSTLSAQHGFYFPRALAREVERALFGDGVGAVELARWARRLDRFVAKMTWAGGNRPLLIRNPANSTRLPLLRALWPDARFIHIHREPAAVIASSARMFGTLLRELAVGRRAVEPDPARALVHRVYPRLLARLLDDWDALPPGRGAIVAHAALAEAPLRAIDALELPIGRAGWRAIEDWAVRHRQEPRAPAPDPTDRAVLAAHAGLVARIGYAA